MLTIAENPTSHMYEDMKGNSIFKALFERVGLLQKNSEIY